MNCTQFEKIDPSQRIQRRRRPVFDYDGARQMLPLVNSILKEIVERSVKIAHHELRSRRAADGASENPRLKRLFAIRDYSVQEQCERQRAIDELSRLGVRVLDPVRGVAGFPTMVNGALAYFIHELDSNDIRSWRYRNEDQSRAVPVDWKCRDALTRAAAQEA